MDIFGPFAGAIGIVKFTIVKTAQLVTRIYGGDNNKKDPSDKWISRAGRYVANSPPATFLTSSNFQLALTGLVAAAALISNPLGNAVGSAVFSTIVAASAAGIAVNGHNLYKHKQMLKSHSVLDNMLKAAQGNQQAESALDHLQRATLRVILPEGRCKSLSTIKPPPKQEPISFWSLAALRGVFTPGMLVTTAASLISFNPIALGLSATGWVASAVMASDDEKTRYNKKVAFTNSVESAKHQLGCLDIESTAQLYKRIVAERAVIAAVKQGKSEFECRNIYNKTLAETVSPIRKATKWESVKGHAQCSGTVIRHGFSSKATAALYSIPDSLNDGKKTTSQAEITLSRSPSKTKLQAPSKKTEGFKVKKTLPHTTGKNYSTNFPGL